MPEYYCACCGSHFDVEHDVCPSCGTEGEWMTEDEFFEDEETDSMTGNSTQITPAPRSIKDIIADLSKPLEARHLKTRKQGGHDLTYIEWHTAAKYLTHYCPAWSYAVKSVSQVGNLITVIASISIPCLEGVVTREATGCEDADAKGYGDSVSNAEAMALKRAASKFGLGLYLYSK